MAETRSERSGKTAPLRRRFPVFAWALAFVLMQVAGCGSGGGDGDSSGETAWVEVTSPTGGSSHEASSRATYLDFYGKAFVSEDWVGLTCYGFGCLLGGGDGSYPGVDVVVTNLSSGDVVPARSSYGPSTDWRHRWSAATVPINEGVNQIRISASDPGGAYAEKNITVRVPERPYLDALPGRLDFAMQQYGADPAPAVFEIGNIGSGEIPWTLSAGESWFVATPANGYSGESPVTVTASVNGDGLGVGVYTAYLTVTDTTGFNAPAVIPVALAVNPSAGPVMDLDVREVSFSAIREGTVPEAEQITISNIGSGSFTWSASADQGWLIVTPSSGSTGASASTAAISIDVNALLPGTHTGTITFDSLDAFPSPQTVSVSAQIGHHLELISLSTTGAAGNWYSSSPSASFDGSKVAFASGSSNLSPDDSNDYVNDIFLRDRTAGTTALTLFYNNPDPQRLGNSTAPRIASGGSHVCFSSESTLVADDTDYAFDIYVSDLESNVTTLASAAYDGSYSIGDSKNCSISADGRYVVFQSSAPLTEDSPGNLLNGYTYAVYLRDLILEQTLLVSRDLNLAPINGWYPVISDDGRYVAFSPQNSVGIFLYEVATGAVEQVAFGDDGSPGSGPPSISADGRFVLFATYTPMLTEDTDRYMDVYVWDRQSQILDRVSRAYDGSEVDGSSNQPAISDDGRYVVFRSTAKNLAQEELRYDRAYVYVRDMMSNRIAIVSLTQEGLDADCISESPDISGDGRVIVFKSCPQLISMLSGGDQIFTVPNPLFE